MLRRMRMKDKYDLGGFFQVDIFDLILPFALPRQRTVRCFVHKGP